MGRDSFEQKEIFIDLHPHQFADNQKHLRFFIMKWTGFSGITEGIQNRQETRYRQEMM